jgi:hypothetical protein
VSLGFPPLFAVILSCWFLISPFVIHDPFTVDGQDAILRDMGFALALLFTSVAPYRARSHHGVFHGLFGVLAALLIVEAVTYDGWPNGSLGGASWNELVPGVLMVLTTAAGWWDSGAAG